MNLAELQAKLDDKLFLDGAYRAFLASAGCGKTHTAFIATTAYPNKDHNYLNPQQVEALRKQGYTVTGVIDGTLGTYQVSGWFL